MANHVAPTVAPSSISPPPVDTKSPMAISLMHFADVLFDVQDSLRDGDYKLLQDAAQALYRARMDAPPQPSTATANLDTVRDELNVMINHIHDENDELREMLAAATTTIDRQRDRLRYLGSFANALTAVLEQHNVPDDKVLEACSKRGIKEKYLADREAKRKRVEAASVHDVDVSSSSDDERDGRLA